MRGPVSGLRDPQNLSFLLRQRIRTDKYDTLVRFVRRWPCMLVLDKRHWPYIAPGACAALFGNSGHRANRSDTFSSPANTDSSDPHGHSHPTALSWSEIFRKHQANPFARVRLLSHNGLASQPAKPNALIRLLCALCLLSLSAATQAKPKVFASEPARIALAGEHARVFAATHAGQDPHPVEARPSPIARLRSADPSVCTGAELESGWVPILQRRVRNPKVLAGQPGYPPAAQQVTLLAIPTAMASHTSHSIRRGGSKSPRPYRRDCGLPTPRTALTTSDGGNRSPGVGRKRSRDGGNRRERRKAGE